MVITLSPEIEAALTESARRQGVNPEVLALNALRERFLMPPKRLEPRDDWERRLSEIATDSGVSLSNEDLRRERLYD